MLVQFYPVLAVPVIAVLFRRGSNASRMALLTWALYAAAKFAELFDVELYALTGFWSGHTFKHFIAAAATGCVLYFLTKQRFRGLRLSAVPARQEAI